MSETKLNKQVLDLIKQNGGYAIRVSASNSSGTHDILACINGRFCSFEDKLEYNKMSELQVAHRNDIIKAGGLAKEIKSLDDAQCLIDWAKTGHIQKLENEKRQLKSFTL